MNSIKLQNEKNKYRIAHLILAHSDPEHIKRLARRLSMFSDVYIHIDKNIDIIPFKMILEEGENISFLENRYHCEWGGWNSIPAEIALLKAALDKFNYDRFVFLQGGDYPIKSNEYIIDYFEKHPTVEFIRACNCSHAKDKYLYGKCRYYVYPNNRNILKRIHDKVIRLLDIKMRSGIIKDGDEEYDVYWGSAQWAITNEFARYVVNFYESHPKFNRWFYHAFPADEMYFQTVLMNSKFRCNSTSHGPEAEKRGLVNWRNLHYFEYEGAIRVFEENDFELLKHKKELYARKLNTEKSGKLYFLLDNEI